MSGEHWLVADIGGTNTRCAIGGPAGRPAGLRRFRNAEFPSLRAVLGHYLDALPAGTRPDRAALAIAAPIVGKRIRMMNIAWSFSVDELAAELGLAHLQVVNDFAAIAWSLPALGGDDLRQVGGGIAEPAAPRVVLGPGTGLGTAGLVAIPDGGWLAVSAEGGHVTLPAVDEAEDELVRAARRRFGHCSAERLISGPGLRFIHEVRNGSSLEAAEISRRAAAGDDAARESLAIAFRMLGTVAGNLALSFGALGGVYIAGGVVPPNLGVFEASGFRERFEDKGRYREYLGRIPTFVITEKHPALVGLLNHPRVLAAAD